MAFVRIPVYAVWVTKNHYPLVFNTDVKIFPSEGKFFSSFLKISSSEGQFFALFVKIFTY